jgi:hypothetical protein
MLQAAINIDERAESSLPQRFSVEVPLALQSPVSDDDETVAEGVHMPRRSSESVAVAEPAEPVAVEPVSGG